MVKIFRKIALNKGWWKLTQEEKKQARKAITLFLANPKHPSLRIHKLKGKLEGFKAFSVNYDLRIIFVKKAMVCISRESETMMIIASNQANTKLPNSLGNLFYSFLAFGFWRIGESPPQIWE